MKMKLMGEEEHGAGLLRPYPPVSSYPTRIAQRLPRTASGGLSFLARRRAGLEGQAALDEMESV